MFVKQDKNKARVKRHMRVRNHISGTPERPEGSGMTVTYELDISW